ncbi:hypothetical protein ELG88_18090 [Rhizobium leguminosarum]|uniref:hypothetical protein n=1 Tax=Rhizobium leguminosarum TaxID=384 RepID=UPI0010304BF4|nr:hypothetical protein [Rhizobium leguminosarum]TBF36993.1 hypothetical protein ELG88_18090 [Rhizobium leguminosarum]
MDPDLIKAMDEAFEAVAPGQSEEFRRRFRKLVENALVSNHGDSEVRRVLELVEIDEGGEQ